MTEPSLRAAVKYLQDRLPRSPLVILVLGSGLAAVADHCTVQRRVPYADIPGFPTCSTEGHAGRLASATWRGLPVAVLEGRAHPYEGHSQEAVTRPIRALAALGARILITTCAAGALHEAAPGTLFLIDDHLNLMGGSPLEGSGDRVSEPRFVEMADAYDARLRELAGDAARRAGIVMQRGVLACVRGPQYETAAEAEMLRRLGAHAVNMSLTPEVIAARYAQLRVLGLAVLTNRSGSALETSDHHQVLAVAESRAKTMAVLLDGVLARLDTSSGALL
jgi:purine-nucleoside phosphorylase